MDDLLTLTAEVVSAHLINNHVASGDVPVLIKSVHAALAKLSEPAPASEPVIEKPKGAVSARKSLADPAHIISMIDGKPYQTLRRHIAKHGYTDASYREAFGLNKDYPMVAPGYSAKRSALAQSSGLGRKKAEEAAAPVVEAVQKRGRKVKEAAQEAVVEPVVKAARKARKTVGDALEAAREHLPA